MVNLINKIISHSSIEGKTQINNDNNMTSLINIIIVFCLSYYQWTKLSF